MQLPAHAARVQRRTHKASNQTLDVLVKANKKLTNPKSSEHQEESQETSNI